MTRRSAKGAAARGPHAGPAGERTPSNGNAPLQAAKPGFLRDAVKSITKRYPRELMQSLRRASGHRHDPESFIREWDAACGRTSEPVAAWLGHCTVLLRLGDLTVLTDPVLSSKIGLGLGPLTLGVRRIDDPPLHAQHLPPVDLVLLSHPHFDHLDKPTLKQLAHKNTLVVTARNTRKLIPKGFGEVVEIDWDQELDIGDVRFAAMQPAHWGARTAWDRHRGYNSYMIESLGGERARRVLFAGDTAHTSAYDTLGGADLAIFGIGAYEPWIHHHANPEQVWSMFSAMQGRYLMPVHHSTFVLSNEPIEEPMQRLLAAAGEKSHQVVLAGPGDVFAVGEEAGK